MQLSRPRTRPGSHPPGGPGLCPSICSPRALRFGVPSRSAAGPGKEINITILAWVFKLTLEPLLSHPGPLSLLPTPQLLEWRVGSIIQKALWEMGLLWAGVGDEGYTWDRWEMGYPQAVVKPGINQVCCGPSGLAVGRRICSCKTPLPPSHGASRQGCFVAPTTLTSIRTQPHCASASEAQVL